MPTANLPILTEGDNGKTYGVRTRVGGSMHAHRALRRLREGQYSVSCMHHNGAALKNEGRNVRHFFGGPVRGSKLPPNELSMKTHFSMSGPSTFSGCLTGPLISNDEHVRLHRRVACVQYHPTPKTIF